MVLLPYTLAAWIALCLGTGAFIGRTQTVTPAHPERGSLRLALRGWARFSSCITR